MLEPVCLTAPLGGSGEGQICKVIFVLLSCFLC